MKKLLVLVLCLSLCLTMFAGCGSSDDNTFILGLDDTFAPMGFRNESNEIVGVDIDIATAVCDYLGWELVLQPIDWDSKEMELNTGTIDCIWNGMSWSEERAAAMSLSIPYMENEMVFVTRAGEIATLDDLAGSKVAVQSGSTADESLSASEYASSITISRFSTNDVALMDLDTYGVDAVYMDSVSAAYAIETSGKDFEMLVEGSMSEDYVIAFRLEDTDLKEEVEYALRALYADGTLVDISIKWFGEDVLTIA